MFFAFSFTLFKEDIALRLCRWVLVSQGQRTGPDLRPQRQTAVKLSGAEAADRAQCAAPD